MSTLVLTRSDVVRHLDALHLLADLREAFRAGALARTVVPRRAQAPVHAEGSANCSCDAEPAGRVHAVAGEHLEGQLKAGSIQRSDEHDTNEGTSGRGWSNFFKTGHMAGGWDESVWASKGLPTTGVLTIKATLSKCC